MNRAKGLSCSMVVVCIAFSVASLSAWADNKQDTSALSGIWSLKQGETKIEFSDGKVLTIAPHGDNNIIALICEYTVDKEGTVKAKVTELGGQPQAVEMVKRILPVGTEFQFQWKVTNGTAKLDELKGDKIEMLKSHLEGEYSQTK